jgi:septal ring factor EnvC (AmiA/AmiB activator)
MRRALIPFLMVLTAWSPSKLATGTVKRALIESGLSESNAQCMANRMTDKLSLLQLRKLRALRGEKQSLSDYVAAVRKVGDAEVLTVTVTSAALCSTGFAR